nr:MAG TPA: hypothetical protein [Caudoviricetes sp.]
MADSTWLRLLESTITKGTPPNQFRLRSHQRGNTFRDSYPHRKPAKENCVDN